MILQNTTVSGSLTIDKAVGNGNVYLKGVKADGTVYINGGGSHSIEAEDCTLNNVEINKASSAGSEPVRFAAIGSTSANKVTVVSPAIIENENISAGYTGLSNIVLSKDIPKDSTVILTGDFKNVSVEAANITVELTDGTIDTMDIKSTASKTEIVNLGTITNAKVASSVYDSITFSVLKILNVLKVLSPMT